jgi:DNA-binding NtrC family response regulator
VEPRQTVLVVDDDASIRFLCRLNLELEGWTVLEAGTVPEAREQLPGAEVVLLDVHIGSASGVDLLDEIQADYPHVRVAMLTGIADSASLANANPDAVIAKPFGIEQLTETVRGLATRRANAAG